MELLKKYRFCVIIEERLALFFKENIMGLLKCPDCGKEFSDKIDACPNCACPKSAILEELDIKNDDKTIKELKNTKNVTGSVEATSFTTATSDKIPNKKINKFKMTFFVIIVLLAIALGAYVLYVKLWTSPPPSPNNDVNNNLSNFSFSDNPDAIEAATLSVVKVYCYNQKGEESATGSGFIAFNNQTVITNYHVMEEAYTCKILTENNITYEVKSILNYSKDQDIAVLKLKEPTDLAVLKLGDSSDTKKGEKVIAIGSPLGFKNTVSQGVLSGRLTEDDIEVLQFTASISHGSSGGALFNDDGDVIGITYASYVNGQNLNLALPIELAISLYNDIQEEYDVSVICKEKYPYIEMLKEYDNAIPVTLEQLRTNPKAFDGKTIIVSGYLSSFWGNNHFYVTDKQQFISGDWTEDNKSLRKIAYEDNLIMFIRGNINSMFKYSDDSLSVGDTVTTIGVFSYFETTDIPNYAYIDAILLYKE
ncbi:MAG: trypsin-like serine protease [Ruminococcaceae bacterium]|nr:trypsin-like serine protease [Oscillospiraceae bacterium]